MATISWKLMKVGALVGTIPAIGIGVGYRMRSQQVKESRTEESRVFKISEIPVYNTSRQNKANPITEQYPRNAVESEIGTIRKTVQDVIHSITETYMAIDEKVQIGIAHSQATIDYLQNDTNEVVRIVSITVAGLGGWVLGYKRSVLRKMLYSTIGAGSVASLCYPKASVALSEQVYSQAQALYEQAFSESKEEKQPEEQIEMNLREDKAPNLLANDVASEITDETPAESVTATETPIVQQLKGDPGQSNPEDKDMYSTRSS